MAGSSRPIRPYAQLSWAMVKTGVLGYGGGPSIIPLIRYEAVHHYRWMDEEEFADLLAIANALPGPIATKLAAYLGYRLKGGGGAAVAVLAHILPSAFAMIALMSAVQWLSRSPIVQGMIAAVTPVICVMLGVMAYEFGERAVKGLGKAAGIGLFAVSFVLLQWIGLHAAIVIAVFLAYGAFHFRIIGLLRDRRSRRRAEKRQEAHETWSG
ncbi:putative transporter YwrB [Paenibacillus cisolokensis]|uniref:Transporter YwrB n=1 Tax=Paenibacillus cisolokensis TaxID=1658519 RepID=A0ABQ4NES2_9BACL|nr:chromate transporter [Paenibacillus cisolokensis]GIQ66732.1 putative transporter YwrB [Paenibacillus cisolokensis]